MRAQTLFIVAGLLASSAAIDRAAAVEPWVDGRFKVADGLELWLDASRQRDGEQAKLLPGTPDGGALAVWLDGSGHGRHLVQRLQAAQPRLVSAGSVAVVRFDGADDFLAATGLGQSLDEFTLLIVAMPRNNAGGYRALFATNRTGERDYTSGMNVDQSAEGSFNFDKLNVEGRGFGGAVNLMTSTATLQTWHTIEITGQSGPAGVKLSVDGVAQGTRARGPEKLALDEITVGARYYNNAEPTPFVRGFFDGDIAEVLLYSRRLSDDEEEAARKYLTDKYGDLLRGVPIDTGHRSPLAQVEHPPAVQMTVPGFTVKELPVQLSNINTIKYRADGKLVALAYDGAIYLLSDRDGDGLEETVETFWPAGTLRGPIGMALTPPGYARGNGVFVASKGKLSLIVDTDGDDRADEEIVVAEGWTELPHGVDALGVALDRDGSIFFGLGTGDFTNAYQIDGSGRPHYDIKSERGTVLKVSSDFSRREIFCTGIRFSVALAFNAAGDLFCTDQEGATWLANGNPLDELLHLEKGRHYGFPPRHPKHLPDVIDEPSVFDFGPQHQSTCGLNFNEPQNGGPTFGPAWWRGDALVAGYSRGKLYRNKLVKTAGGYVSNSTLLAALNMLCVDACVSPAGALVVAVHSGGPDWGSGPTGPGKLYKILYTGADEPQPVLAWAESPREVRIAFDWPLETRHLQGLAGHVSIAYGPYVRAADRFESLRPGYAAVIQQMAAPRFDLPVHAVNVTPDRRTLMLATDPQPLAAHYAVTLPAATADSAEPLGVLAQQPAIDLAYDLSGVAATWEDSAGETRWSGWLPHVDLAVAQAFTAQSDDHDRLWTLARQPGKLALKTQLNLRNMLRPAVQPGSRIDYEWPNEEVTLVFRAAAPFNVKTAAEEQAATANAQGQYQTELHLKSADEKPLGIEIMLATSEASPTLDVWYFTNEDARARALPLERVLVPWASIEQQPATPAPRVAPPELAGGSWQRGRELFHGEQAQCAKCHRMAGQGGSIGPDLSNLPHRDYASVLRDVVEPNFAINPDFITYRVELTDGRVFVGAVKSDGDKLRIGDKDARETIVDRGDVESLKAMPISTMPEGLLKTLASEQVKDLMTFLLLSEPEPLAPASIEREGLPPARARAELDAVLKGSEPLGPGEPKPLKIVLVAGEKDHGVNEHDYPLWQKRWAALFGHAKNVQVGTAFGWPKPDDFQTADVMVWYSANPGWSADKGKELDAYQARGGGMVLIHYAVNGNDAADEFAQRIGLAWRGGQSKFRHGPLDLNFKAGDFKGANHPITRGFTRLALEDESYWQLTGDPRKVAVLASSDEEGQPQPLFWAFERDKGRVFGSIPGHFTWTFDDALFRELLLRATAWTAREPTGRFDELTPLGARFKD